MDAVEAELARKGVLAFDPRLQVQERDQAVAATIEASLEMLDPLERQRCAELAIFPQDVAIPLAQVASLWQWTGGLDADAASDLIVSQLDPLSIVDYDGGTESLAMHDVFRRYLASVLPDRAGLHATLRASWGDRPQQRYAWRWLAFYGAAEVQALPDALRHAAAQRLVALTADATWQQQHEAAVADLPALREALASALDAAVAVSTPGACALLVEAADALRRFDRELASPESVFELARRGDLGGARRRSELFLSSIDMHWRHAVLLVVAWLAPASQRDAARALAAKVQRNLGDEPALHDLLAWVRADLHDDVAPSFAATIQPAEASPALIEQLLRRVGGAGYDRELIASVGIDADAENPDMPTRGLYRADGDRGTTTRYLADIDSPWLGAYACADLKRRTQALARHRGDPELAQLIGRNSRIWRRFGGDFRPPFSRIGLTDPLGMR